MELTYYGANCIHITTKDLKILLDPVTGEYGPNPKLKTDVVMYSQEPKQEVKSADGFTIDMPGEYEIKGVNIEGIPARLHTENEDSKKDGVMYVITYKDIRVLACGNIYGELDNEQVESIDGVDVLIVPVGGKGLTLDKEAATSLVRQFTPGYVVPVHYADDVVQYPVPQDSVDAFLHEVGASDAERQTSLKVNSRDTSEDTKFAVLEPQSKK